MNMDILDNLKGIKKLDKSNLLGSVQQLWLQLKQTKEELKKTKVPRAYGKVNNIVINGMGGSRLGARVTQRLFEDTLKIPVYPIGSYHLPAFVNDKTLLIISSYSGNTEEPLSTVEEGLKREAKMMVLAQNGRLAKIAQGKKLPGYYGFIPKYNPCNQTRMGLGYQILGIILLLSKCGLIQISPEEIDDLIVFVERVKSRYDLTISSQENLAKKLAKKIKEKIPVFVAAEFLMGGLHVWKNQTNENAKQMAIYFEIPELNHHLLEGMSFPKNNPKNFYFVFLKSDLYYPRNQKRIEVTKKVLDKYKIKHLDVRLNGETKLEQTFELIQLGSFVGFYLSILNNLDPSPIPWVDFFKKKLKEPVHEK
jgi:glucose/mannose-6-phosphate isomerase